MRKLVLLLGLAALACDAGTDAGEPAPAAPAFDAAAEEQRIRDLDSRWVAAVAAKDTAAIRLIMAENSRALPPNMPIVQGANDVVGMWAGLANMPGASLTFEPSEIEFSEAGDMAYEVGTWQFEQTTEGAGAPVRDNGKYVVVWQNVNGEWKVVADIWNSDNPAAGAPAS